MQLRSISQQRAIAYAPKPFAVLSFFSSSYVVYHLFFERPEKRSHMYHRLVLAINLCLQLQSAVFFWGSWAVPKGTPNFAAANGTMVTCTIQGFLNLALVTMVPFYYASLGLYSFIAVKNSFHEEKYKWIEKWFHLFASIPWIFAIFVAANEGINPFGSGCFIARAPLDCNLDPGVQCQRGTDVVILFAAVFGITQLILYFFIPLAAMISVFILIVKARKNIEMTTGMRQLIESARKRVLQDIAAQISFYLFSFWITYIFGFTHALYLRITGNYNYVVLLLGNCLLASQGFIIMLVYFKLHRKKKLSISAESTRHESNHIIHEHHQPCKGGLSSRENQTVSDIRCKARSKGRFVAFSSAMRQISRSSSNQSSFSIFDGTPAEGSPWAQFIDPVSDSEEKDESYAEGL